MTDMLARIPRGHFGAILADPPWKFRSFAASANPKSDRSVERHYKTMSLDAIKALQVRDLASRKGCHLFMCATGPFLPHALDVMRIWGFKYSGIAFTWVKLRESFEIADLDGRQIGDDDFHLGLGFTTRKNVELVLLGRSAGCRREARDVRELIIAPVREHSRKPAEIRQRIERYTKGPYLELFSRERRRGWTTAGDETEKF